MNFAKSKAFKVCCVLFICLVLMAQQGVNVVNSTIAVTQSGTWTVQPGNTANSTAWLVTGTGGTFPVTNTGTFATQATLQAGSAIAGKFGIDQTTPGTTNGTQDASTGSTGSAVPSKAAYIAGVGSGNLTGYINCDNTAIYDASTSGSTQLVALSSSKKIYVCGGLISTSQTTAVSVKLIYGTGTACATGSTNMTPAWPLQAGTSTGPIGLQIPATNSQALATAASNELCINTSGAVSVQALIYYTQF